MDKKTKTIRAFTHGRIITPEKEIPDGTLIVAGRGIQSLGRSSDIRVPDGAEVIECTGKILTPGFIDIHLHGGGGYDFSDAEGLAGAARFHASQGTTAMLPTLCPESLPKIRTNLALLGKGYPQNTDDESPLPEIIGLHLEGPFLNPKRRGAFDAGSLLLPRSGLIREFFEASGGALRLMTLAPELDGGMALIREAKEFGIIPCLGHSDATYEQAAAAFHIGIRHATHLFNAMRGFHHRAPGCALSALLDPEISVEVVVDGHHLHEAAVEMVYRLKGRDKMILVTDAAPLSGLQSGSCMLAGQRVEIRGEKALNQEGNLAGSLLSMAEALRLSVQRARISLVDAARMATLNPAQLLGLSDIRGRLFAGGEADLVILNGSLKVDAVYIGGRQVPEFKNRAAD